MENRFEIVAHQDLRANDSANFIEVFRDRVTGVVYLYRSTRSGGGLTVLLDKDGQPTISEQELQNTLSNAPENSLNSSVLSDDANNMDLEGTTVQSNNMLSQDKLLDFGGLKWQILASDGNRVLLITADVLKEQPFDENSESEEVIWATSSLRKYLNDGFLQTFSAIEKNQIMETINANEKNTQHGVNGGYNTTDKVFLLSIDEAEKYFVNQESRISKLNGENIAWWLRSPGEDVINAAIVDDTGIIDYSGQCVDFVCGIRPALWRKMN